MVKSDCKSVDEYIASQPEPAQAILRTVRSAIWKALPDAEEVISYKMPAYKLSGGIVLYFASWKQHYSIYPAGDSLVAAFRDDLASYRIGKGTIRLPLSEPVPVMLIERIAKFRAKEVDKSENQKRSRSKGR